MRARWTSIERHQYQSTHLPRPLPVQCVVRHTYHHLPNRHHLYDSAPEHIQPRSRFRQFRFRFLYQFTNISSWSSVPSDFETFGDQSCLYEQDKIGFAFYWLTRLLGLTIPPLFLFPVRFNSRVLPMFYFLMKSNKSRWWHRLAVISACLLYPFTPLGAYSSLSDRDGLACP
jgi:hypothetical protein